LWQANDLGHPKPPQGIMDHVHFCPIWGNDATMFIDKEKFIYDKLSKYVKFCKMGMCNDETYIKKLGPYMVYWETILELLSLEIQPSWNVFGLLAIGGLIACEVPLLPLLFLLIKFFVQNFTS
jgi:hypothetical protein